MIDVFDDNNFCCSCFIEIVLQFIIYTLNNNINYNENEYLLIC